MQIDKNKVLGMLNDRMAEKTRTKSQISEHPNLTMDEKITLIEGVSREKMELIEIIHKIEAM